MRIKNIFLMLLLFVVLAGVCIGASAAADSSTVVAGEKYTMTGTATGSPGSVQWYLFGPNYFRTGTSSVIDAVYEISFSKEATKDMDAGKYYLVIQHPMYDKVFNIGPVKTASGYVIKLNNKGPYTDSSATVLFDIKDHQSSNAVYALEKAIGDQNIDDWLTTIPLTVTSQSAYSFGSANVVYEGDMYPVTGTTTGHVNDMVRVEFSGLEFVPQSKESPSSAGMYREATTRIDESGYWRVDIDTTGLNPGTYVVTVYVGSLSPEVLPYTVQVVTRPETPVPTFEPTPTPVQPTPIQTPVPTPTPASPGFGIIALLGIGGALLLKRK